jgi:membrane fusion protein (multidrug efflux system)
VEEAPASSQAAPPPAVTVVSVVRESIAPTTSFTGRVEAVDTVDLRARVAGFLEQRLFVEGADVAVGDLLFILEKAPYEAQVEQIKATVARAEATLQLATIDRKRQQELVKRQAAAQAKLDESVAKEGEARADLQRQKAELQQAELDLSYTEIRAPIAGRIGQAVFSVGDYVTPESGALATIVSQDPITVLFPVTQRELLEVRKKSGEAQRDPRAIPVRVELADGSQYQHAGTIDFVDVQADPGTDTVTIRAELKNPDRLLIDGQVVGVVVETAAPEPVLLVPQQALQADQQGVFVLVVDTEDKVQVRRIAIGRSLEGRTIVSSGLEEGERVITEGVQKVRPGQVVAPGTTAAAAEAP